MAATYLAHPVVALDNFFGTDPDQDADSFLQPIERKPNLALEDAPVYHGVFPNYTPQKSCFLLRGLGAEWYGSNVEAATTWDYIKANFIARLSDGRNKLRHRVEGEHCSRKNCEETRNLLYSVKRTDKCWPDDVNGIPLAQKNPEQAAQETQRKQRYTDYSLRGLRPRYLHRKAREHLMDHPNAI